MLTLQDVLDMEIMGTAEIMTGQEISTELVVHGLSVIEHPVEHYVQPHELMMTSAIGLNDDPELLRSFVEDAIDSPACCLIIATG